jgi:RNA polymerase sigma-70 factor (ECF subfamily)
VDAERALALLPEQQRVVIVLHRLGLDADAIADALGVPVGTVKSRLARARVALAPMLREDSSDV